jgi:hypothetical protein
VLVTGYLMLVTGQLFLFQSEIRNPKSQIEMLDAGKKWYRIEGLG